MVQQRHNSITFSEHPYWDGYVSTGSQLEIDVSKLGLFEVATELTRVSEDGTVSDDLLLCYWIQLAN